MNNFDILKEVLPNGKTQFALKDFVTILLESYFFQKCKVTFVKNSVRLFNPPSSQWFYPNPKTLPKSQQKRKSMEKWYFFTIPKNN